MLSLFTDYFVSVIIAVSPDLDSLVLQACQKSRNWSSKCMAEAGNPF